MSSVDERHQHHHVLEATLPLAQPSVWAILSAPVMTASGFTMTMPATPTKGGAMLLSRIVCIKKWGMRRRGTISTPSEVIGALFFYHSFLFLVIL